MRRIASLVALATGLVTVAVIAPAAPATASPWGYQRTFSVDHTNGCVHSVTAGGMAFAPTRVGQAHTVAVTGTLADERPPGCDDPGLTYADFTANVYLNPVDSQRVWLDSPPVTEFMFVLTNGTPISLLEINSLDIQVCRTLDPDLPPVSCGPLRRHVTPPPLLG